MLSKKQMVWGCYSLKENLARAIFGSFGQGNFWKRCPRKNTKEMLFGSWVPSKRAGEVWIYTHKEPGVLLRNLRKAKIHRSEALKIVSFAPDFLDAVAHSLDRSVDITIVRTEGTLFVTIGDDTQTGRVEHHSLEITP